MPWELEISKVVGLWVGTPKEVYSALEGRNDVKTVGQYYIVAQMDLMPGVMGSLATDSVRN